MADPLRVLLIGGSGVFGSRLAELASREAGIALTLGGRNLAGLQRVAAGLTRPAGCVVLDRDRVEPAELEPYDVVVDAAGPFQQSHDRVIRAAVAAGIDYIDLADGRQFVATFPDYDAEARGAGVTLVTGASSIPALSHAVLDRMTDSWAAVDSIRVAIYPGNRAPRGRSVVEAILSYVGKPVRVFREGRWQSAAGWGQLHRERLPRVGNRWAAVCDTPEQDLLVERYRPRRDAEFFAGLELPVLHLGLWLCSLPVRWGWIDSLRPFAGPMLAAARLLQPLGTDRGAMRVTARGESRDGVRLVAQWDLAADGNRGPYVPVLAALALLRRRCAGRREPAGARICAGMLAYDEFSADLAALGIWCEWSELFESVQDNSPLDEQCTPIET